MRAITFHFAFAAALFAVSPRFTPAWGQIAGTANLGGPQPMVGTPIPDGDFAAVAKRLGLVESSKPARELIKGWQAPRKILVGVDNNTNRLAWLAASGGEDMWIIVRENLKRYVAGDKLYSVVDPRRGW